jgi:hypothetical protein
MFGSVVDDDTVGPWHEEDGNICWFCERKITSYILEEISGSMLADLRR